MRILVTGAGLIGCYSAARLADAGHSVVLLDVSPNNDYIGKVLHGKGAVVRTTDIANVRELPELQASSADKVDMVVHTAGVIGGTARANPYAAMRTNLVGTIELAEAARASGVRRIVYASTHGVYELDKILQPPFQESAPVSAHSVYGATKLSSEHVLQAFCEAFGMETVVIRFPNVYGYGEFLGGSSGGIAFQQLLLAAMENVTISIPHLLNGYGEWLYVKDAALAVQNALENPLGRKFVVVNVGNGVLHDEHDIVRAVNATLPNAKFLSSRDDAAPPKSTERHVAFDLSTAKNEIGYYPRFSLEVGVRDYLNELKRAVS